MASGDVTDRLLFGWRVVDLSDGYGALATRLLADFGADVVRLEEPGGGLGQRRSPRAREGMSLHYLSRNANKSVLVRHAAESGDRAEVHELLARADVVLVANGWGRAHQEFDPRDLSRAHPHLVVVSLTPFGLTGPAASWKSTELVEQAISGAIYRAGVPELPPVAAPGSFCEDVGATSAALAAVLGIVAGSGDLVDVASALSLAQCADMAIPLWSMIGADQQRSGAGLYPLFACTDGLARLVLPMTAKDWRALIDWMGSPPEWTGPQWERAMLAEPERAQVVARLPDRFARFTREEITAQGDAAGLRITPVLTPAEVLSNEHAIARETFTETGIGAGRGAMHASAFSVNGVRAATAEPPSPVGLPDWPARSRPDRSRHDTVSPATQPHLALEGIRVLELGSGIASPEAAKVLGEWGAQVIKVESRARLDFQRLVMGSEMNPAFASPNRNKMAFGANLATAAGRELVRQLIPHVDVVVENNAAGVLDRLGVGWDVIHELNPRAILVSTQLYGDRGPWSWRKGYGPSARAISGLTWLWAHDAHSPRGVQVIHPDHLAGRLGAFGAISALISRRRTGAGCRIDLAQCEVASSLLGDLLLAESLEAGAAQPIGNTSPDHCPWGIYPSLDDGLGESWLAVSVGSDDEWASLCSVAGDDLHTEDHWRTEAGRLADSERVDEALRHWTSQVDCGHAERLLQAAGVAAGQVLHPRVQSTHPQYVARNWPLAVDQPGCGALLFEGTAFVGTELGAPRCGPAPLPGEHTVAICKDVLGLDDDQIDALVAAGALDPIDR